MKRRLKVHDRVRIEYGGRLRNAIVVEDRGNLSVGGKQLVRIVVTNQKKVARNCSKCGAELVLVEMELPAAKCVQRLRP